MKHTKGEWKAVKGNSQMTWPDETTVCQINYGQDPDGFWFIISDAERHGDEKATAQLIAAAPDLLEAAKIGLEYAKKLQKYSEANKKHAEIIEAAIRKATK